MTHPPTRTDAQRYRQAQQLTGPNHCPIEAGFIGRLADNECHHGRLAGDRTPPCGCWAHFEGARVIALPHPLVADVVRAARLLGRLPQRAQYAAIAAEHGWSAPPAAGWRHMRAEAHQALAARPDAVPATGPAATAPAAGASAAEIIACVARAIDTLGHVPTRAEYTRLAAAHGWPAPPPGG